MITRKTKNRAKPLDSTRLDDLALRYVSRYATTRAKLRTYLSRKVRERGWDGAGSPDIDALVGRLSRLGYVDDEAFAVAKANALQARGLGRRRLVQALRVAGVEEGDQAGAMDLADSTAVESALRYARRRRLGPFAAAKITDPKDRERAIAAFVRAGHSFALAKHIIALDPRTDCDLKDLVNDISHTME